MFAGAFLALSACSAGQPETSELKRAEIPGSIDNRLDLGQAYDADRASWGNLACVEGPVENLAGEQARLEYTRDISFNKALSTLAGELSAGVDFPSVGVEGDAEYANSNSASKYRETHTLSFKYSSKRRFQIGKLKLSERGRYYSTSAKYLLRDRCKNEFVNEIDVGLVFMATMSVEFKNTKDKEKFGGSLKVDVLAGAVNVEGKLQKADEEEKKSVRITLSAIQKGGDARELASILLPEVVSCDASNLAPCIKGFGQLIKYGNKLPGQIQAAPERLKIISYHTASYADSGLEELVANDIQEVDELTLATRDRLEDLLRQARKVYARASTLLGYGELLSKEQLAQVAAAQQAAFDNRRELTKALLYCYHNPYMVEKGEQSEHPCSKKADAVIAALKPIDEVILEIKDKPVADPAVLCEAALVYALRTGVITQKQYEVYKRIGFAPEYAVAHDRNSAIIGWGECGNLIGQL